MAQLLPQKVARATGEGLACLFTGMHLVLKGWMRIKWSAQVLAGLPWVTANPRPHVRTPRPWAALPLCWVRPECHLTLGLLAFALGKRQVRGLTWRHLLLRLYALTLGQTRALRGAGADLPRAHNQTHTPRGETWLPYLCAGSDPTWH